MVITKSSGDSDNWISRLLGANHRLERQQFGDAWHHCQRLGVRSISSGCLSYSVLNFHVCIAGGINGLCRWCGPKFVTALLLHSHVGIAYYLYERELCKSWPQRIRVINCAYVSVIFGFGSILLVAATKSYLPASSFVRGVYSFFASLALISMARNLLALIESDRNKCETARNDA